MLELYRDLCRIFVLTMLELCRDARKNVCRDVHKKLCRDAKHILRSQLPVSDAGWSCEGRSVVNGLSDDGTAYEDIDNDNNAPPGYRPHPHQPPLPRANNRQAATVTAAGRPSSGMATATVTDGIPHAHLGANPPCGMLGVVLLGFLVDQTPPMVTPSTVRLINASTSRANTTRVPPPTTGAATI